MHRRIALRALGASAQAMLLASISACAVTVPVRRWHADVLREHPLAGKIWDVAAQRFVTPENVADTLCNAPFRLLGEVHDNPDHHAIQAELLNAIGAGGVKPVVAFEQFDGEYDAALQRRQLAGKISADDVAEAVNFDRQGWEWTFYRPLVEIAIQYSMPIRAANLSRGAAGQIAKQGLAALEPGRVTTLQLDTTWSTEKEQVLRDIIIEGHCHALPGSMVPAMVAAQRARDATLAAALLNAGSAGAVLIAGNGHVRRDFAVPVYLQAAAPGKTVCAVGILEVAEELSEPQSYLKSRITGVPQFDFAWFTPRRDRLDPCTAFKAVPRARTEPPG